MPPKKKSKAKGKGGKKKRSRSRSRSRSKGRGKKMGKEQASAVMVFVMVEARKQSILLYRTWLLEQKEEATRLRQKLRRVEKERYSHMRNLIDTTDAMSTKIDKMHGEKSIGRAFDTNLDAKLIQQREDIEVLYDTLTRHSNRLSALTTEYSSLLIASRTSLEDAMAGLRATHAVQIQRHQTEIDRLYKKHEQSIEGTRQRADKIVLGVESVASQQELDEMSVQTLQTIHRNRKLHAQVAAAKVEIERLETIVEEFEERNLELSKELNLSVDWNLGLGLVAEAELEEWEDDMDSEVERGRSPSVRRPKSKASTTPSSPLPPLPVSKSGTPSPSLSHLTLTEVLHREAKRREVETKRSGLGVTGKSVDMKPPDPRHAGGLLYQTLCI
ncbi:uncharacterized protein SPPG_04622 [Spizellomyces punctatus DAOM BR117]|uniref:Uncharacterized protein n=1 Tax=Spizellomyces punctatus (strain DAOM BR117) TaxID=645134 RepID=A0A0L0HHJ6_SPIPD|nr:uncharacterized protein SPPG_04622 [Spizellomyces punctatus DAOM BR117]KND00294.1 hypothetical protein SPPG_04622 [Spizellomyces punctatus DAOM BR117]|eukprot:XP_016608333.1 hypothetical protein SPPG_04622 [Spizellomyces punctatus DAOM BR117]